MMSLHVLQGSARWSCQPGHEECGAKWAPKWARERAEAAGVRDESGRLRNAVSEQPGPGDGGGHAAGEGSQHRCASAQLHLAWKLRTETLADGDFTSLPGTAVRVGMACRACMGSKDTWLKPYFHETLNPAVRVAGHQHACKGLSTAGAVLPEHELRPWHFYMQHVWGLCWCAVLNAAGWHAGPVGSRASHGTTPPSVDNSLPSNVELSPGNLLPPLTALSSTVPGLMSPTAEVRPDIMTSLPLSSAVLPAAESVALLALRQVCGTALAKCGGLGRSAGVCSAIQSLCVVGLNKTDTSAAQISAPAWVETEV